MSDHDPTPEGVPPVEGHTAEYPTVVSGLELDELSFGAAADEDDEWPVKGPARGVRLAVPAAALLALLLVAAGFWCGAIVEKRHAASSANGGAAAAFARFRSIGGTTGASGASGPAGFPGGFGGSTAGTTGTISVIDGDTLYILTSTGALVKVALGASTTVTRNAKSQPIDLRPGDTVVIQGATSKNGDVAATSVAATAPGVSTGGGRGTVP